MVGPFGKAGVPGEQQPSHRSRTGMTAPATSAARRPPAPGRATSTSMLRTRPSQPVSGCPVDAVVLSELLEGQTAGCLEIGVEVDEVSRRAFDCRARVADAWIVYADRKGSTCRVELPRTEG